jgi:hypothetical protein
MRLFMSVVLEHYILISLDIFDMAFKPTNHVFLFLCSPLIAIGFGLCDPLGDIDLSSTHRSDCKRVWMGEVVLKAASSG